MTSFDHHAEVESYNAAMRERDQFHRATAGPYTLSIPPNGRATLYEADSAGADHEVPFGVNNLDALVQFAGEVIRLNAMVEELQRQNTTLRNTVAVHAGAFKQVKSQLDARDGE